MKVSWDDQAFAINLKMANRNITDEAVKIFEQEAELMRMAASLNAPFKHGFLEDSIVTQEGDDDGEQENSFSISIGIDENAVNAIDFPVLDYGERLEHGQIPRGTSFNRGPGTEAKGTRSGGGFMARAIAERIGTMGNRVAAAIKRGIAKTRMTKKVSTARGRK